MSTDDSRERFNALRHYSGVRLQQGRVLLDADFNEAAAIGDRRLRALASDILGRATVSQTTPEAFKISSVSGQLQIGTGRMYVDGLLAENNGAVDPAKRAFDDLLSERVFVDPIDYLAQPYLPNPDPLPTTGTYIVYLKVWNREVTYLEQPDLVEIAVGVDTSSRVQTVWQVQLLAVDPATTCGAEVPEWSDVIAPSTGVLTTGTFEVAPTDDPCELPPTGGYRGLENQLYRVQIHDAGQPGAGATFTWSRDTVGSRVASMVSATELELETLGRDDVLRFNTGDWVEIINDAREFSRLPGDIRRIANVDDVTRRIRFDAPLLGDLLPSPATFPSSSFPSGSNMRVGRGDQKGLVFRTDPSGTPVQVQDLESSGGLVSVPAPGTTLLLENGVTVSFDSIGGDAGFKTGDNWAFAARTADASVELLDAAPPLGVAYHYARLGIWDVDHDKVTDCRNVWPPAVEGHECSCTACVTAESHMTGKFTIQDAVNQVQKTGGTVCLGPGHFALREPVLLKGVVSVKIKGQGPKTVVTGQGGVLVVQSSVAIAIEELAIVAVGSQSAISVHSAFGLSLRQLVIDVPDVKEIAAAISLQGIVANARISENLIVAPTAIRANDPGAVPPSGEPPATFLLVAAVVIEDNSFSCATQAVALAGEVHHVLNTRIAGNEMLGCSDTAISTLGLGLPGSSMAIAGNNLNIAGNGISCAVDGARIHGNKIVCSPLSGAAPAVGTKGIALVAGPGNGAERSEILANQVSGFSFAGVTVDSPTRDLIVRLNSIESCGNGILSTGRDSAASVSIENNDLRDIGGRDAGPSVMGIAVRRADTATIVGNSVRTLGTTSPQTDSALRAAVFTLDVRRARVSGNRVSDIGPPGDLLGQVAGIMLRAPCARFQVSDNQVECDPAPLPFRTGSCWALAALSSEHKHVGLPDGLVSTVVMAKERTLMLGAGGPYVSTFPETAIGDAGVAPRTPRGAVVGNELNARGTAPAVEIQAAGECLFNDNRVELVGDGNVAAVRIDADVAIVNANRVRSDKATSIDIIIPGAPPAPPPATVLGNITTQQIKLNGAPLPSPWTALNVSEA